MTAPGWLEYTATIAPPSSATTPALDTCCTHPVGPTPFRPATLLPASASLRPVPRPCVKQHSTDAKEHHFGPDAVGSHPYHQHDRAAGSIEVAPCDVRASAPSGPPCWWWPPCRPPPPSCRRTSPSSRTRSAPSWRSTATPATR